jgi:glycerol-3-phosphate dehydrogenase
MELKRLSDSHNEGFKMKSFSAQDRSSAIKKMESDVIFDLFIIGGGITGAGVARDAVSRGMTVALAEKTDFAQGTSSRSSKLIHGGIRYLENLEFGLVFEALSERSRLFSMAPHLVHPLRFILPVYKGSRVGPMLLSMGMWLYDILALFRAPMLHERLSKKEALKRMPSLKEDGLECAFEYSDAYMDDDRLVIETLRSAHAGGAQCANYVEVRKISLSPPMHHIDCYDHKTKKEFRVKARHIVSSLGPWTDQFASGQFKDWKDILRPTKGVHLTLRRDRLNLDSAVVMVDDAKNRIVFGIPRHEMSIIGTTDTDFKESPDSVNATKEDIKYLLEIASEYFPGAKIQESDIVASYSGVRPLVKDESSSEGKTSREHTVITQPEGITWVAGGKYTTYRKMAEDIVDSCLSLFSLEERVRFGRSNTKLELNSLITEESYHRAKLNAASLAERSHLTLAEAQRMIDRHGPEAFEIVSRYGSELSMIELECLHAIDYGMCFEITDFMTRRMPLFLAEYDHGASLLPLIVRTFAKKYNWSSEEQEAQISRYQVHIRSELSWRA